MNILHKLYPQYKRFIFLGIGVAACAGSMYIIQCIKQQKQSKSQIDDVEPSPKQNSLINPEKSQTLEKIYDKTLRTRDVLDEFKPFVSEVKDLDYLLEEYGMNDEKVKELLKNNLIGMRRARGDGNCFYTSFGYQYLEYIFNQTSDEQFQDFIKIAESLPFSIICENEEYQQNEEMKNSFSQYCRLIRAFDSQSRGQKYFELFSNPEGQFYGLSIIFLRNLTYNLCQEDEETKSCFEALELDLKKQILTWEFDCENNQSVINLLSNKLQIDITLYFMDEDHRQLQIQNYKNQNQQTKLDIYIIFRPGHYNVAIPNNKRQ